MHESIHASSPYETGPGIEPGTFGSADECSTTELTLLLISPIYLKQDIKPLKKNALLGDRRKTHLLRYMYKSKQAPSYVNNSQGRTRFFKAAVSILMKQFIVKSSFNTRH